MRVEIKQALYAALSVMAAIPLVAFAAGQEAGVPVQMLITAEASKGHEVPVLSAADIAIRQGNEKETRRVEEILPLDGAQSALQMAILIDDGADSDLSLQFDDLRNFMNAQPPSTEFGIFYMRNGAVLTAQAFTADRALAGKALRLPLAQPGIAASPYDALADAIKKWPATTGRREVLMISSGIDLYSGPPALNPYLGSAIEKAQRAGVLVHSIYYRGAGHFGHDIYRINFGRDNLSLLGDDTGGEAYWEGLATSVSFQPYLNDLSARLKHQYLVTFLAKPGSKAELQNVKLRTELPHVELMGAAKVWIPSSR